jgi:hypothetical protein
MRYSHRHSKLGETHGYTLLSGLMGDIVLGSDLFGYRQKAGENPVPLETLREVFLDCHISYMPLSDMGKIADHEVTSKTVAQLNAIIDQTLEPLLDIKPFHALSRAELEHRQRRRTTWIVRCVEEDIPAITPFLDRDVLDFASRIPHTLFYGKHLYKRMIQRHLPKVAAVPLSDTGMTLSPSKFRAGITWRIQRLLRPLPAVRKLIAKRSDLLNFKEGLRKQTDFFRARLNILEELSPPLQSGSATRRMQGLLAGTEQPSLQACALLPPAVFMGRIRVELNERLMSVQQTVARK